MKYEFESVLKKIYNGEVEPIYFLNGDDYYLQKLFIDGVSKALSTSIPIEKTYFIPDEDDLKKLLLDLESISFFTTRRLFIIHNMSLQKGRMLDDLFKYLDHPNINNTILFIMDNVDGKNVMSKELTKRFGVIYTSPPLYYQINKWIHFLLRQKGLTATPGAIEKLKDMCGDYLYHVANEIDKISVGTGDRMINEQDVMQFSSWGREVKSWELLNSVGEKDLYRSLFNGMQMLNSGIEVSSIIFQLSILFQELLYYKMGVNGFNTLVGFEGFLLKGLKGNFSKYSSRYSMEDLRNAFKILSNEDRKLKSMEVDQTAQLVSMLYRIEGAA